MPYAASNIIDDLVTSQKMLSNLLKCFQDNHMKSDSDKCNLLASSWEETKMEIAYFKRRNSTCEKLLGVYFDNRLTFGHHISELCKKANNKLMHKQKLGNVLYFQKKS